ncbi:ead/Ea22-like family protein [Klebsiella pneumoniae]|uniref:ead/Ea22-like family protein n=1 Tax=Klebsiella pneumoniae TaxID=573 RepID=UPI00273818EA|nr:ead/Ea22-like family protein [Klebsiella pneumoniae]
MTDITELAQSLKAAAEKAIAEEGSTWWNEEQLASDYGLALHRTDAKFIALASHENVLALVEALEKAQRHANLTEAERQAYLGLISKRDERIAELEDAEQKLCAANVTLDARADRAERQMAELESRTVKLPPELYTIGELIRTQDNRITDQPMFVVFQKREIIGSDEHSPSRICWVWDGEEVSELRAKRLESLYQDGRDTRGYDRYAMQEVDEFVTACFTEHGCKDFLRQNGHNLRQPYIYACGSFRNNEYQLVRNWLAGIKWEAE